MSHVLVVEDEAPMRRALDIGLRARGYEVELATTGEEALTLAHRQPPDLAHPGRWLSPASPQPTGQTHGGTVPAPPPRPAGSTDRSGPCKCGRP